MTELDRLHMPSLGGAVAWLNSEPLDLAELHGRVVLVDFWTLTCINWLRTEPYIRAWSDAYRDDGLVVIGVHTPEFSFEHDVDRVRQATTERGIGYPVAVDNDYEIWSAFDNHYWPALYFVDADGAIRDRHFGEGRYERSERVIQQLLGVERELVSVEGLGVEAEADWDHLRSPEAYLGYGRSERFASPDGVALDERRAYGLPEHLASNHWALAGEWTIGRERVVLDRAGGSIAYRFEARDAHLVLSPGERGPIPFRVLLDGEAPGPSHGVDVDEDGNGVLGDGRLYQLIRQPDRDPRADARDHVPRGRRRGVRLHVRLAGAALEEECCQRVEKPVAVSAARPAPGADQELVQLWTCDRPQRLDGVVLREAERPVGCQGVDEHAKVPPPVCVELREELCELGLRSGGAGDDSDERRGAFEAGGDVGGEHPQLLVLIGRRGDRPRLRLLRDGLWVVAADGAPDDLSEQRALVSEAGVDGLFRDTCLVGDRGDARAVEPSLVEQRRSGVQHSLPCLCGLLGAPVGTVVALDIALHVWNSITVFNKVILHSKERP